MTTALHFGVGLLPFVALVQFVLGNCHVVALDGELAVVVIVVGSDVWGHGFVLLVFVRLDVCGHWGHLVVLVRLDVGGHRRVLVEGIVSSSAGTRPRACLCWLSAVGQRKHTVTPRGFSVCMCWASLTLVT